MTLQSRTAGNIVVLQMEPGKAANLHDQVADLLQGDLGGIVVNMTAVPTLRSDDLENLVKSNLISDQADVYFLMSDVADKVYQAFRQFEVEDFFVIFKNEESAIRYIKSQAELARISEDHPTPRDRYSHENAQDILGRIRKKTQTLRARSSRLFVPEMSLKVFVRKTIKDLFYVDLLGFFVNQGEDVFSGKDIAEQFGVKEGDIKKALDDLSSTGVLKKTSTGLFGKPTYSFVAGEENKNCILDVLKIMKAPGGKRRIISWMREK